MSASKLLNYYYSVLTVVSFSCLFLLHSVGCTAKTAEWLLLSLDKSSFSIGYAETLLKLRLLFFFMETAGEYPPRTYFYKIRFTFMETARNEHSRIYAVQFRLWAHHRTIFFCFGLWYSFICHLIALTKFLMSTIFRQMELGDKLVGFLLTLTSLSIFTYYTFWVIILVSDF